jgi:hypothetical protein
LGFVTGREVLDWHSDYLLVEKALFGIEFVPYCVELLLSLYRTAWSYY